MPRYSEWRQQRGLSALSGEWDSLLRCVSGMGEAGASIIE